MFKNIFSKNIQENNINLRKGNNKIISVIIIFVILTIGVLFGVSYRNNKSNNTSEESYYQNVDVSVNSGVQVQKKYELTITAGGDLLIHDTVFKTVKLANGKYNFTPIFKYVKPIFEKADLSIINLEVPVAGNKFKPSNYPAFNSPVELLDAVKDMGVDIVSTANNHALDKGYIGLQTTIENAKNRNLKLVGTKINKNTKPFIIEKNNIKLGVAAYTYGTNGIPIPKAYPYCVNIIDKNKMLQDINYMKSQNVDFIIFTMHFGQEYQLTPNANQKDLVNFLVNNGVDVIFGSHPHVPQPYELKKVTLANGTKKQAFVIYSLGNFVSAQTDYYTKLGGIATVKLSKQGNEKKIEKYEVNPIYTYMKKGLGANTFKVVPLKKSIDDSNKGIKNFSVSDITKFKKLLTDSNKVYNKLQNKR